MKKLVPGLCAILGFWFSAICLGVETTPSNHIRQALPKIFKCGLIFFLFAWSLPGRRALCADPTRLSDQAAEFKRETNRRDRALRKEFLSDIATLCVMDQMRARLQDIEVAQIDVWKQLDACFTGAQKLHIIPEAAAASGIAAARDRYFLRMVTLYGEMAPKTYNELFSDLGSSAKLGYPFTVHPPQQELIRSLTVKIDKILNTVRAGQWQSYPMLAYACKESGEQAAADSSHAADRTVSQASTDIEQLQNDYWEVRLRYKPERAFDLGIPSHEVLTDISFPALQRYEAELSQLNIRLQALKIHRKSLPHRERIYFDFLESLIHSDLRPRLLHRSYPIVDLRDYISYPWGYIMARKEFLSFSKETIQGWEEIARILEKLPNYYKEAESHLREGLAEGNIPNKISTEYYGSKVAPKAAEYYAKLPAFAAMSLDRNHAIVERLEHASTRTIRALGSFTDFLNREVLPEASQDYALGMEELNWRLKNQLYVNEDADQILRRLETRLAELSGDLDRLKIELAHEMKVSVAEVHNNINTTPVDEREMLRYYHDAIIRAENFIRLENLFDLPSSFKVEVMSGPSGMHEDAWAFYRPVPIFRDDIRGIFYITKSSGTSQDMPPIPEIAVNTVHEALPGHDLQFRQFHAFRNEIPRYLWLGESGFNIEGWAMYVTDLMRRKGFFTKAEEYFCINQQISFIEYAIWEIKLHARKVTWHDVVTDGMTQSESQGYFQDSALWPLRMLDFTLGQMEIERLKEEYKKAKGKAYSEAQFHRDFLKEGPMPTSLIGKLLLED
ncbi:MAG: DUF885 family protein [Elusimicrobia bacterium]|nr:DUF885 family protein [Elusimicrobiota bacterium]